MLLRDFILQARESLSGLYPEREAHSIVEALCNDLLGVTAFTHILEPEYVIPENKAGILASSLSRLLDGEPLQYVSGYADFYGFRFKVTPDTLIPRQETELLCRNLIYSLPKDSAPDIIDLCTGSGCIAWTLALSIPNAKVTAIDVSDSALEVAGSQNFPESGLQVRKPVFIKYDLLSGEDFGEGCFDVLASNPPYVRNSEKELMHRNVLDYEPGLALFVPDDDPLIFYRAIADFAIKRLRPGGFGIVEINEAFGDDVAAVFSSSGFSSIEVIKDFAAKNRFVRFEKRA